MQKLELKMCFSHTPCKAGTARCHLPLFPYKSWSKILMFSNEPPRVLIIHGFLPLLHWHYMRNANSASTFRLQNIIYANQLISFTVFRKE